MRNLLYIYTYIRVINPAIQYYNYCFIQFYCFNKIKGIHEESHTYTTSNLKNYISCNKSKEI